MNDTSRPVVCITGAGRGLGAALARRFARGGFDVVLAAQTAPEIDQLAEELTAEGVATLAVQTDVRVANECDRLIDATVAAQTDRDSAQEDKIGPSLRWVGWLTRNAKADWEILLKTGVALDGGNKLCVFQKITPTSMPERVIVATVDADSAIKLTDELGRTSTTEGRPVFQILDSE